MSLELAEAFIQAGELADALDALDAHLAAHPDDHDARRLRIEVLVRMPKRAAEALGELETLPELTEKDQVNRFRALAARGFSEWDGEALVEAYRHDPRQDYLALHALTAFTSQGQDDQALELLADLPKTPFWLVHSAQIYARKGEYRVAVEHFCTALDQTPPSDNRMREVLRASLLLGRAGVYLRLREFDYAAADYAAAEAIVPTDPMITFSQSQIAFEQGNLELAVSLFRTAFERAPEDLRANMANFLRDDATYTELYSAVMG